MNVHRLVSLVLSLNEDELNILRNAASLKEITFDGAVEMGFAHKDLSPNMPAIQEFILDYNDLMVKVKEIDGLNMGGFKAREREAGLTLAALKYHSMVIGVFGRPE